MITVQTAAMIVLGLCLVISLYAGYRAFFRGDKWPWQE